MVLTPDISCGFRLLRLDVRHISAVSCHFVIDKNVSKVKKTLWS